jgi:regulator of RNase E activity RraA
MRPIPSTANIADACLTLGLEFGVWPELRAAAAPRLVGPAVPVQHFGSVDVFLEAIGKAAPGSVLMVDNQGRRDEGCIGDLVVREAKLAKLGGIVIWGTHRDSADLEEIGFPVFSLGNFPVGPRSVRERSRDCLELARFGDFLVSPFQFVIADQDGVVAVDLADWPRIRKEADAIRGREAEQARRVEAGLSLRQQFKFDDFLERREREPAYAFRDHLRRVGGEIER